MTCPEGTGTGATSSMGGKDSADPCPPRQNRAARRWSAGFSHERTLRDDVMWSRVSQVLLVPRVNWMVTFCRSTPFRTFCVLQPSLKQNTQEVVGVMS